MPSVIDKDYFSLAEVMEELSVPQADLAFMAETGQIRVSVLVYDCAIERGYCEAGDPVGWFAVPTKLEFHSGLLDLKRSDAHRVMRHGRMEITEFDAEGDDYIQLQTGIEALSVGLADLFVRKCQYRKISRLLKRSVIQASGDEFEHSPDYRFVRINGEEFWLGAMQACIVRLLHEAWLSGERWISGSELLERAGSSSIRLYDLFKSKGQMRHKLLRSNGKGLYCLALSQDPGIANQPASRRQRGRPSP